MKYVITKALEYHSILEELPTNMDKTYLCRVVIDSDYGKFHIDCIDTWVYPYGQYMMDKKDILYTTLDEAIKSLGASRRVTILPDGTEIIPEQVNYPSSSDVFIQWHPGIQELWPGEY